ncbi:MAG: hypothetical protein AABY04_00140 [Candidatus Micrarchaeota archaeon]
MKNNLLILLSMFLLLAGCTDFFKKPTPTPEIESSPAPIVRVIITENPNPTTVVSVAPPATPTPQTKRKFTATDESTCSQIGGSWQEIGNHINCYVTNPDANKPCTDSSQCIGYCLSHVKGATSGLCAPTIPLQGCDYRIEDGKEDGKICLW